MFKKVSPYIWEYKKYTVLAAVLMCFGIVASILPYFFIYQLLGPLTRGEDLDIKYAVLRIVYILICEVVYGVLYTQGLIYSHISAYNTLKNLRTSLQRKLENQPLGNIMDIGTGRLKKIFIDDIDQIELLLAHRLKTIKDADQILLISDGEIKERGTHAELMSIGGQYSHMVELTA